MSNAAITHLVFAFCGVFGLAAFVWFFALPVATAYSRAWERVAAVFLSLYVLLALIGAGVGLGALVIFEWNRITG